MASFRNGGLRRIFAAGAAGLAAAFVLSAGGAHAAVTGRCALPDAYFNILGDLDRTERLVTGRRPVRIVVLGPVIGVGEGDKPVLERALEKRLPGINFEIIQALSPGLAEDDFEHLRSLVAASTPDLVIWQVGVRDAMASSDVDDFEEVLDRAAQWIEAQGPDLILVDPPFVPHVKHERIYVPYVGEIDAMSQSEGVPVMRRYAAMQHLNSVASQNRIAPSDAVLNPCMPEIMAEAIGRAVAK